MRTRSGEICVQVGRLQDGRIGVIGDDGAWADDHAFHPIPLTGREADSGMNCGPIDANGNAFIAVTDYAAVANAFGGVLRSPSNHCIGSSSSGRIETRPVPCPPSDQRAVTYGLLGPDAVSVAYHDPTGRVITEPTSGPDGAFLLVVPHTHSPCLAGPFREGRCERFAESFGPVPRTGMITEVSYRDGHACHLPSIASGVVRDAFCPPRGYVAARTHVTQAEVSASVTARAHGARHYCASTGTRAAPCSSFTLAITFTARVAATEPDSYYELIAQVRRTPHPTRPAGCPGATFQESPIIVGSFTSAVP